MTMESLRLKVQGMTCMGCVASVTRVLKEVPGVSEVAVSLENAEASVEFDSSRTNRESLRAAIEAAGFDARD
jgi:copper chaperone